LKKKRNNLKVIKEKHDQRLIKDRGPNTGRGEGGPAIERIEWKGLGSKDQDLNKTKHERIEREREHQMLREKKLMTRCIEMKERI
jgi:hypothetical protein